MSKPNKVNPGQYTQAGRLSPDDAARERANATQVRPESVPQDGPSNRRVRAVKAGGPLPAAKREDSR